jgi:hypothetical protein
MTGPIRKPSVRWTGAAVVVLGSFGLVIYPVLPDRNAQSLEVVIERLVPGPEEIGPDSGLTKNEVAVLNSLGLKGKLHSGIQSYSGSGEKSARALIVIRGPLTSKITLQQPKATNVVYVHDGITFRMYPSDAPTVKQKITLAEGNSEFEGLTVGIDPVIGKASTFTWSPPIKRTQQ